MRICDRKRAALCQTGPELEGRSRPRVDAGWHIVASQQTGARSEAAGHDEVGPHLSTSHCRHREQPVTKLEAA